METVLVEDVLHRFLLERAGVRGVLVRLGPAWREVAGRDDYPAPLRDLLGQSLAASALLTGNIKLDGALSVELKSTGALRMLFAECTDQGRLRGLARWGETVPEPIDLAELPNAVMAITIGHAERGQRYQGLVDLQHADLAAALENYFRQSEQLPARIVLAADGEHAVGLMLQKLPGEGGHDAAEDADAWPRIEHLTGTLGAQELLTTP
ncbi:MAG: Hsp33 family molecular chaperone HslO, partial [Rhodanobacter sp.]